MKNPGFGQGKRSVVEHGGAGKGDKNRTTNIEAFRVNYDEIDWGRGRAWYSTKRPLKDIYQSLGY